VTRASCATLALLAASPGCFSESDDFNARAAEHICAYNRGGPDEPLLDKTTDREFGDDAQPYAGPSCEDDVITNLESCASKCEYNAHKGRRCLRKLRRSDTFDNYRENLVTPCDDVYECETEDAPPECEITTIDCSVGGAPTMTFAMLGLLGLWARRRSA